MNIANDGLVRDLRNRIYELSASVSGLSSTWLPYLISSDLDQEPELRNKIFVIFISGLSDSCYEIKNRINGLKRDAKRLNNNAAQYYLSAFYHYLDGSIDLIGIFSKEEMIFIKENRDQILHGRWDEMHKMNRRCKYVADGKLIIDKISSSEYWKLYRSVLSEGVSVDTTLERLRKRFYSYKTLYWSIDAFVRRGDLIDLMLEDITNDSNPRAIMKFHPDGYQATKFCDSNVLRNIYDLRDIMMSKGEESTRLDPVIKDN